MTERERERTKAQSLSREGGPESWHEKGPSPSPERTEERSYISRLVSLASTSLIKKKVRS